MNKALFIKYFGYTLFLLLGIASIVLYRERVMYVDSAYYAFNLYNNGYPCAEHNRFALYLYQLIPWAMIKLHFSVSSVLQIYSLNHILLHAIPFAILLIIKQYRLALLLALMQILSYRECFFLTVNETALAISSSVLLSGLLQYNAKLKINTNWNYFYYFLCILVAFFSHPMAMILIPFVIGFHFILFRKEFNRNTLIALLACIGIAFGIKKYISSSSGYEDNLFSQLNRTIEILCNLKDIYSFKFFFGELRWNSYLFNIYIIPLVLMAFFIVIHIKQKRTLELAYYVATCVGFWLIIIIFFNQGDGNIFMEKNFTPWVFTSLYPVIYLFKFESKLEFGSMVFCSLFIVFYSVWGIHKVTPMYTQRLKLMKELITNKNFENHNKLILQDSSINHDIWLGIWALPYETILLSKDLNISTTTAKIYHNEESINKELHRDDIFLGADFIPVLPESYLIKYKDFHIPKQKYHPVKLED
jgi:hypothetical protein